MADPLLRRIECRHDGSDRFPFTLPAIAGLDVEGGDRDMRFEQPAADTELWEALTIVRVALSPTGLLGLLRRMKALTLEGGQFLIAPEQFLRQLFA